MLQKQRCYNGHKQLNFLMVHCQSKRDDWGLLANWLPPDEFNIVNLTENDKFDGNYMQNIRIYIGNFSNDKLNGTGTQCNTFQYYYNYDM